MSKIKIIISFVLLPLFLSAQTVADVAEHPDLLTSWETLKIDDEQKVIVKKYDFSEDQVLKYIKEKIEKSRFESEITYLKNETETAEDVSSLYNLGNSNKRGFSLKEIASYLGLPVSGNKLSVATRINDKIH